MKGFIFKQKMLLAGIAAALFVSVGGFIFAGKFHFIERLDTIASNPSPFVRHFAPTWRSIKKIIDLPYLAASVFMARRSLPVYEIELSKNDRSRLINNLPNYPKESRLYESFKNSVKATFRHGSYRTDDAKIRYRGVSPNHWNALKKSIQVNLPPENPLKERTALRFFIGEDKGWVKGLLWNHLAEKFDIMSPKIEAVNLVIDKKQMGVYMLVEGWEESFLERNGKQFSPLFANKNLPVSKPDLFRPEAANQWYNRFEEMRSGETFPELIYFLSLIANAPDAVFTDKIGAILDIDTFLRWSLLAILSGDFQQLSNGANINFYFNNATGKFEPALFDATFVKLSDPIDISPNRLINRVLAQETFRARFEQIARSYLSDSANLASDLAFYDLMTDNLLPSIYRDSAKIQTSFEARKHIAADRNVYRHNFLTLASMLETNGIRFRFAEESYPLSEPLTDGAFSSFRAISASRNEFLKNNPSFTTGADPSTVILLPGTHIFTRDVIVPRGLTLIIREGAYLYFGPSVSIVSYSSVKAAGTAFQPIAMRPLIENKPWGVFAIVNAPQKSVFSHVSLRGGSDATINGIYFSGMLSAHGNDISFTNGRIEQANADDGIHVLSGKAVIADTFFHNNNSDGIDIDFAGNESFFERNLFTATDGDAMDLSFSKIIVRDNTIETCGDKGISVGESSTPRIEHNIITGCVYGIAIKDRSEAIIIKNTLEDNEIAIGLYRKKPHFISGGSATLIENEFVGNKQDTFVDEYSKIIK